MRTILATRSTRVKKQTSDWAGFNCFCINSNLKSHFCKTLCTNHKDLAHFGTTTTPTSTTYLSLSLLRVQTQFAKPSCRSTEEVSGDLYYCVKTISIWYIHPIVLLYSTTTVLTLFVPLNCNPMWNPKIFKHYKKEIKGKTVFTQCYTFEICDVASWSQNTYINSVLKVEFEIYHSSVQTDGL